MYIDHVNQEDAEGLYTCEVTTFPTFARTSESKRLTVVGEFVDHRQPTHVSATRQHSLMHIPVFMAAHSENAQELKNDDKKGKNSAFAPTTTTFSAVASIMILSAALVSV